MNEKITSIERKTAPANPVRDAIHNVHIASCARDIARLALHDLIESAFEAGRTSNAPEADRTERPTAPDINRALDILEASTTQLYRDVRHLQVQQSIEQVEAQHRAKQQPMIFYWPGQHARKSVLVCLDHTRTQDSESHALCRVVNTLSPLSLGHALVIKRAELHHVGPDMQPLAKPPGLDVTRMPVPDITPAQAKGGATIG